VTDAIPLDWLFYALFALVAASAFFAMSETCLMALNRYRLKHLIREGSQGAKLAGTLLDRTDELLSFILAGNTLMKGYLGNPAATEAALAGGLYHSGDLAVWHPDGSIEVKDRSKDIIISGGENISSLEVEEVLYRHPQVMEAAVVAKPDNKWGETPCAFVTLKPDAGPVTADDIMAFCRANMAGFKVPRSVMFGPLPKTSTGKIQKFVLRQNVKGSA